MDPSAPTFAVTMVANTGAYASGWWWYFGQTASQVDGRLSQNNAELTSIDPYQTSAGVPRRSRPLRHDDLLCCPG
jgi:hypothetical protein